MTALSTDKLEALLAAITPGPWVKDKYSSLKSPTGKQVYVWDVGIAHTHRDDETEANTRAIALVPDLLRDLIAARARIAELEGAADRDADRCAERINELERLLGNARAEARRMDLARDQFLGERNMLAEALRSIASGDMTGMMELTEAEAARAKAKWAIGKIGQPVASRIEMLEAAIHDALGRHQVTHIHEGLRVALSPTLNTGGRDAE